MRTRIIGAVLALLLAVVGTAFLVSYVNTADKRAFGGAELVDAYFVSEQIPAGTNGDAVKDFLEIRRIPAAALSEDRVKDLADISGKVASVDLLPGEQLISNRWVNSSEFDPSGGLEIPDGYQAITVALPVERVVGGTVQAGGTVGIVVTSGQPGQAKQILHKVLVLSVTPGTSYVPAANSNSSQATEPVSVLMVTLALKTPDLEKVAWGVDYGKLWLTREPASAVEGGNVTTDFNLLFG